MPPKRKRESEAVRQSAGTAASVKAGGPRTFHNGLAVKDALGKANIRTIALLQQQIHTVHSQLPLAISHPTVVLLQQFLEASPTCDEIFSDWQAGDRNRDDKLVEAAVMLLAQILRILTPIPFFRKQLVSIVERILGIQERFYDKLHRMILSSSRDLSIAGLHLAAAAVNVDPPDPSSASLHSSSGRAAIKVWTSLVEGGAMKVLGKMLAMRRRMKDGTPIYQEQDPLDAPDIRHLVLQIISPLFSSPVFHTHARPLLKTLYTHLPQDPPLTILRLLNSLWAAISGPPPGLSRKSALALLNDNALHCLIDQLSREDIEPSSQRSVADIVSAFLHGVTTIPGKGLCFADEGWYPRQQKEEDGGRKRNRASDDEDDGVRFGNREDRIRKGIYNRVLSNVVNRVGGKVVDDNGRVGAWVVKMLEACPELIAGYWPHSALDVSPRATARWIATAAHIGRIVALPPPASSTFKQPVPRGTNPESAPYRRAPPTMDVIIESVLPSPFTKQHSTKGLQHADYLVQYMTATTLARCLQKLAAVQELFRTIETSAAAQPSTSTSADYDNAWARRQRELETECRRRTPEIMVIIAFAQKSATLAQPDAEGEVDPALVAKSTMMTEVALRLFRLYYATMPSIGKEAKFDVGRLLVSSSSVKQERRERRETRANAGSVADEVRSVGSTGSLVSAGTAGTAGMGGGFGYVKGVVEGFEAMSQVHVLKLLGAVNGWQWTNKASSSQYTYFYHILQLHLASTNPTTIIHTTALLFHLLIPTPLYDHDPSELTLFLACLPRLPAGSGAAGVIQQVHVLSFLDDCVRRAIHLPYRYIDQVIALVPGYFKISEEWSMISPLMAAVLEQWSAKVAGGHIGSEAAAVVANVMHRLVLSLVGKLGNAVWVDAYVAKMETVLVKLREEGKAKEGLERVVRRMRADVKRMKGEKMDNEGAGEVGAEAGSELLDEREWSEGSFERVLLDTAPLTPPICERLQQLIDQAEENTRARYARFAAMLLASRTADVAHLLAMITSAISRIDDSAVASRTKRAVLDNKFLHELYLSGAGDGYRKELDGVVACLVVDREEDRTITDTYVLWFVNAFKADKKGKRLVENLDHLSPWIPFFESDQAKLILDIVEAGKLRLSGTTKKGKAIILSDRARYSLEGLVERTGDADWCLRYLPTFIVLGLLEPYITLIKRGRINTRPRMEHGPGESLSRVVITADVVQQLMDSPSPAAARLLREMVTAYPAAAVLTLQSIASPASIKVRAEILPVIAALLDVDIDGVFIMPDRSAKFAQFCTSVLIDRDQRRRITLDADSDQAIAHAAIEILAHVALRSPDVVQPQLTSIKAFGYYASSLLCRLLAVRGGYELGKHLFGPALRWAVETCSDGTSLKPDDLAILRNLGESVDLLQDKPLESFAVEPLLTAITQTQEHLARPVLSRLATSLTAKCDLRASFIRQQLQFLTSSKLYASLSLPSSTPTARLPFIRLYAALFHASTYTSCQPPFVEPLLPLYRGTLALADRLILGMWQTFEAVRHISVASLIEHWSAGPTASRRPIDALTSLDSAKVLASCVKFPLRRTLSALTENEGEGGNDEGLEATYDPVFVMSLFGAVIVREELSGLDWVEILRSNVLGMTICALSSRDEGVRGLAGWSLAKTGSSISKIEFHERDQLHYTLLVLRHALVPASSGDSSAPTLDGSAASPSAIRTPRLPILATLFLAHTLHAQSQPSHFLYPLTSRFLLQRPVFDPWDIPMLYTMLLGNRPDRTGSGRGYRQAEGEVQTLSEVKRGRGWMVRLLRDGVRSEADWSLVKRRNVFLYLADMYTVSLDIPFRRLVLQALESMIQIPQAARSLTYRHNLIPWIHNEFSRSIASGNRNALEERGRLLGLVEGCVRACVYGELRRRDPSALAVGGQRAVEAAAGKDEKTAKEGKKVRKGRDGWLIQVELFVRLVCESKPEPLHLLQLSRIANHISLVSPYTIVNILPTMVDALMTVHPSPAALVADQFADSDEGGAEITENLFRAGLALGVTDSPELAVAGVKISAAQVDAVRPALESLSSRIHAAQGEVGDWVRREKRLFELDEYRSQGKSQ